MAGLQDIKIPLRRYKSSPEKLTASQLGSDAQASRRSAAMFLPVGQRGPGTMLSRLRSEVGGSTFQLSPLIII